jgi:hypothetical protein
MRDHTRNVLISVIGIAAVVVAMGFGARAIVRRITNPGGETAIETVSTTERRYEYRDFNAIESRGAWEVELVEGAEYGITVRAPEGIWNQVDVVAQRSRLVFDLDGPINLGDGRVAATVTMPAISEITTVGGAKVTARGFETDRLLLDIDGAAAIDAAGMSVGRLVVESDGAASIDFSESTVDHANVRLDGASLVKLSMAGGSLTGRVAGLARVEYSGEVASQEVEVSGLSQVKRVD